MKLGPVQTVILIPSAYGSKFRIKYLILPLQNYSGSKFHLKSKTSYRAVGTLRALSRSISIVECSKTQKIDIWLAYTGDNIIRLSTNFHGC